MDNTVVPSGGLVVAVEQIAAARTRASQPSDGGSCGTSAQVAQ